GLDHDLEGSLAAPGIAADVEGDVPGWRGERFGAGVEPDGGADRPALDEFEAPVAILEEAGFFGDVDVAGEEKRLGVAVSERLKLVIVVEEREGEVGQAGFGVEEQSGFELTVVGLACDVVGEVGA